jgi:hypothetical protein
MRALAIENLRKTRARYPHPAEAGGLSYPCGVSCHAASTAATKSWRREGPYPDTTQYCVGGANP